MLTDPRINNQLINYIREHEVLETAILQNDPFHILTLHKEYKLKCFLTNQQWLEYELAQIINKD